MKWFPIRKKDTSVPNQPWPPPPPTGFINAWSAAMHDLAREKGWWDEPRSLSDILLNIQSEIIEAWEEVRSNLRALDEVYLAEDGKPEGFPIELADAVIRIFDLCGAIGIDLHGAIRAKHEYNKTRPHRHGGKVEEIRIMSCIYAVADEKDPREMLKCVRIDNHEAMATNGIIAMIVDYEPELISIPEPVLVPAEDIVLLARTKEPIDLAQNSAGDFRMEVKNAEVDIVPRTVKDFPDLRSIMSKQFRSAPKVEITFDIDALKRLVKCMDKSGESNYATLRIRGPHQMVEWFLGAPGEIHGVGGGIMPCKFGGPAAEASEAPPKFQ